MNCYHREEKMNKEEIKKIAEISMLHFSEDELDSFGKSFSETMDIIDSIKKWDTDGLPKTIHVNEMENHLRKDEVKESLEQKIATKNTKTEKYGYFEIIKFVD